METLDGGFFRFRSAGDFLPFFGSFLGHPNIQVTNRRFCHEVMALHSSAEVATARGLFSVQLVLGRELKS